MTENSYRLDSVQIQKLLPHRAPFLLIDRVLEIQTCGGMELNPPDVVVGTKVVGIKAVSYNEPFFKGHFPKYPVMPGVLIVEAMAQMACMSVYPYFFQSQKKKMEDGTFNLNCILVGVENARFRKPVVPGDSMKIETEITKRRGKLWVFKCSASVDGHLVAEAEVLANLDFHSPQESA